MVPVALQELQQVQVVVLVHQVLQVLMVLAALLELHQALQAHLEPQDFLVQMVLPVLQVPQPVQVALLKLQV